MKLISIVGARPQFIKLAPIVRAIREHNNSRNVAINHVIVHTGQHYDEKMSDIFFKELDLPNPNYNLAAGSGTHSEQTGRVLMDIETVLTEETPDHVIVFGDTNSTLAGALAASKLNIPISHIEAGLRSFNRNMPEEINRIITDRISTLLFCPDEESVNNLAKEGMISGVFDVGDVMVDQVKFVSESIPSEKPQAFDYLLLTLHRQETCASLEALTNLLRTLNEISIDHSIIFPVHPRLKAFLNTIPLAFSPHFHFIDPLGYRENIAHITHAKAVITDSGGIQKEAYLLKTPCITVRTETEWVNTLTHGWNYLVGLDSKQLLNVYQNQIIGFDDQKQHPSLYGEGDAAQRIIKTIVS